MADRVAVINRGILQQVDTPQKLYDEPDNLFVAAFIGSPSMNLMEGQLDRDGDNYLMRLGSQSIALPHESVAKHPQLADYVGRKVTIGIRPEEFEDAAVQPDFPASQRIRAEVNNVEALGFEKIAYFDLDAVPVFSEDALDLGEDEDVLPQDVTRISARFSPASGVRPGSTVEVNVDVDKAHYFDPESGLAIR